MNTHQLHMYLAMGWPIFPCSSRTKAPLTSHGFYDSTTDWNRITAWLTQFPDCAWGVRTCADKGVIDVDPRHGGFESLQALEAQHGRLPETPRVRTGGGGYHYYLSFPEGTKCCDLAAGIERKAIGGYVILPPCRISDPLHQGRAYEWEVKPWEALIEAAPPWCSISKVTRQHLCEPELSILDPWVVQTCGDDLLSHRGSPEGDRHKTLCRLVGVHLARGDSEDSIHRMAHEWAKRCSPPFDDWERPVLALINKEAAKTIGLTPTPPPASYRTLVSISVDDSDSLLVGREGTNMAVPAHPAGLVCSLPDTLQQNTVHHEGKTSWLSTPELVSDAFHGLLGEMLRAIASETEAHPAGILLGWLCCFGSIVGRRAWVQVGPRLHHPALYVGIVGHTSDAKGDSWAVSVLPFRRVDQGWVDRCIANGIGSGEGLIERIADDCSVLNTKSGLVENRPGAIDKRCLLRLSELSRCFKAGRRENATLSEYLREAWDGDPISVPNRVNNSLSTSGYSVSLIGDITPGVLAKLLATGTEGVDGWANRFLWCCVTSSCDLPSGGSVPTVLDPFYPRLADALAFATQAGIISRDANADRLWVEQYSSLKRSGDSVPHTDRARPYVLRLAMLYALADRSSVIQVEHLRAALAVWNYCRESARLLFSPQPVVASQKVADPLWLRFLNAIQAAPGITRTALREVAGHKVPAQTIEDSLQYLERSALAHRQHQPPPGGGRPAECWFPGRCPDGSGCQGDNPSSSLQSSPQTPLENSDAEW